jgi:hypothetical protein
LDLARNNPKVSDLSLLLKYYRTDIPNMCMRLLAWACLSHNAFAYGDAHEVIDKKDAGRNKKKVLASFLYSATGVGGRTRATGTGLVPARPMGNQRGPNAHHPGQTLLKLRRGGDSVNRGYYELDHPSNRGNPSDRMGYIEIDHPMNRVQDSDPGDYYEIDQPLLMGADDRGDYFNQPWGSGPMPQEINPNDMEMGFMGSNFPDSDFMNQYGQSHEIGYDRNLWGYPEGADQPMGDMVDVGNMGDMVNMVDMGDMVNMGDYLHPDGPREYSWAGEY